MKVGIMQPYLFPYFGYFQLINAVDTFVVYDDVQYIKNGWINRNKIQLNKKEILFTFGVKKDSATKLINQRFYSDLTFDVSKKNFLTTITLSYGKTPYFKEVFDLLYDILNFNSLNVSDFNTHSLKLLCRYMGIDTKFLISSNLKKDINLKSHNRIIEINKILGSDTYINPIGGSELYSRDIFRTNGVTLYFIKMRDFQYLQFSGDFIPFLSIIDILMFNSQERVTELLNEFELM